MDIASMNILVVYRSKDKVLFCVVSEQISLIKKFQIMSNSLASGLLKQFWNVLLERNTPLCVFNKQLTIKHNVRFYKKITHFISYCMRHEITCLYPAISKNFLVWFVSF